MTPRDNLRAALVAIIWGANFVVIDEGLKGFPPFLLLAARFHHCYPTATSHCW